MNDAKEREHLQWFRDNVKCETCRFYDRTRQPPVCGCSDSMLRGIAVNPIEVCCPEWERLEAQP